MKDAICLPKAVIFDTDNTLYPYDPAHAKASAAVEAKATKLLGVSPERFRITCAEARAETKARLGNTASSHSRLLYFQRAIEMLGMKTQLVMTLDIEQTYWRTFLANTQLFPEIEDFLLDLRRIDILTAIITDLTSQIQFRKIVYFGLDTLFDYVVTSEEAGVDKPDRRPFDLALQKLGGLDPRDVWMIGDDTKDITGGKILGMTTFQKCHDGVGEICGAGAADVAFRHFSELRKLLRTGARSP